MERSYLQVAAAVAPFNGGVDYRRETSAAVFDPRTMPHPVVAPRGGRGPQSRGSDREEVMDIDPSAVPIAGVGSELDWAGHYVKGSAKKHVAPPPEVCAD